MTKFRWQTIVQFEFDDETKRTRVVKSFTTPIGTTSQNRQKGKTKLQFKGSKTTDDEVIL